MIEIKSDRTITGCVAFSYMSDKVPLYLMQCDVCKRPVYTQFAFIIMSLRKAGLLPQDYKARCCYCYHPVIFCKTCGDRIGGMANDGYCYKHGDRWK